MKMNKGMFNRIESLILMIIILCFISLVLFQGLLNNDTSLVFQYSDYLKLSNDYEPNIKEDSGYIILGLENNAFSDAVTIINGNEKYKFDGEIEIKLEVHNNDLIEIDSSMYSEDFKVRIVGISKNILKPKLNTEITTNGDLNVIGTVLLN